MVHQRISSAGRGAVLQDVDVRSIHVRVERGSSTAKLSKQKLGTSFAQRAEEKRDVAQNGFYVRNLNLTKNNRFILLTQLRFAWGHPMRLQSDEARERERPGGLSRGLLSGSDELLADVGEQPALVSDLFPAGKNLSPG